MVLPFFPGRLMELIADARYSVARLRTALISVGFLLLAAAVALIISKALGSGVLRVPGHAPAVVYYGVLGAVAVFGAAEASFGYWTAPRGMEDWRARVGKTALWISLFPLALVAAMGGLAFRK